MPNRTDATNLTDLLKPAAAGDSDAFEEIFRVTSQRMTHLTSMMLANYPQLRRWEQTDDVLQNATIRLYKSLAEVGPENSKQFFGLAALQIRRTLIDMARHYSGQRGLAAHYNSDGGSALARATGETCRPDTLEQWAHFHECVAELPDAEQEAFSLAWYAGLSQREIADAIGISIPTVQRRIYRARHLLARQLRIHTSDSSG